jgi:hypothetical protein
MDARGQDGVRWWGRVPAVVTVRQEPMRAPLPWGAVHARLCEAVATGALGEHREPAARTASRSGGHASPAPTSI